MLRPIILAGGVTASLALYFLLSLYVFPTSYQTEPRRPEAVVTNVSLTATEVELGNTFIVSVTGANKGEESDMQIVSVGFPNQTRPDDIKVLKHNFAQMPLLIKAGDKVGSEYTGERFVYAQYPSVESSSRPWPSGNSYIVDLEVKPENGGTFTIFVKSVAFPHSWEGAHWPSEGIKDYQKEFVQVYHVNVTTKS